MHFIAKKYSNKIFVIKYQPYQIALFVGFTATFVVPYFSNNPHEPFFYTSLILNAIPFFSVAVGWLILRGKKLKKFVRLSESIIATTAGWIAVSNPFVGYLHIPYQYQSLISYGIGLAVFAAYFVFRLRKKE